MHMKLKIISLSVLLFLITTPLFIQFFHQLPSSYSFLETNYSQPLLNYKSSIANQTFFFWNGTYKTLFQPQTIWSGSENYTLISPTQYSISEDFNGTLNHRIVNDLTRIISNSDNPRWENTSHEPFWIHTNVELNSTVYVSSAVTVGDIMMNVSSQEVISLWGKSYDCWRLTDLGATNSTAYYDRNTGFLINGTYEWGGFFTYTFYLVKTNAEALPNIEIRSPSASIFYRSEIPIVIKNFTEIDTVWFRNSSNGGLSWSKNYTLTYNSSFYVNSSQLIWKDGNYILQVFVNNSYNITISKWHYFQVLATGPKIQIISPLNTTYFHKNFLLIIENTTYVNQSWFRFDKGAGWIGNFTITYNGSIFKNDSIIWEDGVYHLQVFANDSLGQIAQRDRWFIIDTIFPLNLSSNSFTDEYPKIGIDSNNKIHTVWIKNTGISYEIIYNNNLIGHFGNSSVLFNSFYELHNLEIVVDSLNIAHVIWMEKESPLSDLYYINNSKGSFGTPLKLQRSPLELFLDANLAVDINNTAHLLIVGSTIISGNYTVWYTNNSDGDFTVRTLIESNYSNRYITPAIGIDASKIVHLFWADNSTGNFDIFYKNNSKGMFTDPPLKISANFEEDSSPDVAIDSSKNIHLTWNSKINDQFDIAYVEIASGNCSPPIIVSKNSIKSDIHPQIAIDTGISPDAVFIAWVGEFQGNLRPFITDNRGGNFLTPRLINDVSENSSSVDLGIHPFEGLLYLIWSGDDSIDSEIYFTEEYNPLALVSPFNTTYTTNSISVTAINSSRHLIQVWYRNRTGASTWSSNYTLTWNGFYFGNTTNLFWPNNTVTVQIFSNDSAGKLFSATNVFSVDYIAPIGFQWINTSTQTVQKTAPIWINGTAWDPSPSSGIREITIIQSNTSNGIFDWSINIGNMQNFAFYNISPIADNILNSFYEVRISIVDYAGNSYELVCNVTIEINPPTGFQNPSTDLSHPQNGNTQGWIWINGTSFDTGFGVKNISISKTNITGGGNFTNNLGNTSNWSFHNTSTILDGAWAITITIFDRADHAVNLTGIIHVDTIPPPQPNLTISTPNDTGVLLSWEQVTDQTSVSYYIYRNGILIGFTTSLSYLDSGLTPGTYNYYLIPIDSAGNLGPPSESKAIVIPEPPPPFPWYLIILLIVIVAASVLAGRFFVRKRKKKIQDSSSSQSHNSNKKSVTLKKAK